MATKTLPALQGVEDQDARNDIALQAIHQIDATLNMLLRERIHESFSLLFESSAIRALDLTSVAMSIMGSDDTRETGEMWNVVYGPHAPEVAHG